MSTMNGEKTHTHLINTHTHTHTHTHLKGKYFNSNDETASKVVPGRRDELDYYSTARDVDVPRQDGGIEARCLGERELCSLSSIEHEPIPGSTR